MEKQEEIEVLDFDIDEAVSNEIDEMLDFIDLSDTNDNENINQEKKLEENIKQDTITILDNTNERLDDYKPSIRDFNIKNAKTRKIVKKAMLYTVIVMLFGFEIFINKTGDVLNDLRVYASDNEPIRIVENDKYGYIDYTGKKIVNPKYSYGEDFVKGYAIVKDSSNLPFIIDKGGKKVVKTGTYFSVYRAKDDIVASKITKNGLKYGILDKDLKVKTDFKYDMISYVDDCYTFTYKDSVGIINNSGKEIFKYKLSSSDDKIIEVNVSNVNDDSVRYASVSVNKTSQIINLNDGTIVSSPTLNNIIPSDNNVFYETDEDNNKTVLYVYENEIKLESNDYTDLSVLSINTGVIKALKKDFSYDYISVKTKEQLKKGLKDSDVYYGTDVFLYNDYDYKKGKTYIKMVKEGEVYKVIEKNFDIEKPFINDIAIVKFSDGLYGYLNKDGNLISDTHFVEANCFDLYGDAVAKTSNGYGVINKEGKIIIDFDNSSIKMASDKVKQNTFKDKNNVFYAVRKDNRYALYNSKGKRVNKTFYDNITFDLNYPIFLASTESKDLIITSDLNEIEVTSSNASYKAYKNYIIVKNEYYNYNGKLIYIDNRGED